MKYPLEKSNELHVPPLPGHWFIVDHTQIPWESEILQSFAELTNITNMNFHSHEQIYEFAANLDPSSSGIILRPSIILPWSSRNQPPLNYEIPSLAYATLEI